METNLTPTTTDPTTPRGRSRRRSRSIGLLALPAIVVAGALAGPHVAAGAAPASPISCGTVVTTDISLTADLHDCPGPGLVVGAPGITIDLAGHAIDGTGSGAGIDNEAGHDGVRITRGSVRGFTFGVLLFQADGARIDRLAVVDNLLGAAVSSSDRVEVDRVVANDNTGAGMEITFSSRVTVRRSTAAGNGLWGIVDRYSEGSRHVDNMLLGNTAPGLTIDRTDGAAVHGNLVVGNESDGIELVAVTDADVVRNHTLFNHGNGISVDSPGNTLGANVAFGNGGAGIVAADGTVDGGRNRAGGNGAGDCTGVTCR